MRRWALIGSSGGERGGGRGWVWRLALIGGSGGGRGRGEAVQGWSSLDLRRRRRRRESLGRRTLIGGSGGGWGGQAGANWQ